MTPNELFAEEAAARAQEIAEAARDLRSGWHVEMWRPKIDITKPFDVAECYELGAPRAALVIRIPIWPRLLLWKMQFGRLVRTGRWI